VSENIAPGDIDVTWNTFGDGDHINIYQGVKRGIMPVIVLTPDQARRVISRLTALLAAGPPPVEMEDETLEEAK